jgi:hypothetical protein
MDDSQYSPPNYTKWLIDVTSWDGLFPIFILSVSLVVAQLLPKNQATAETLMVILPVLGALTRLAIGRRRIKSNHCSVWVRTIQFGSLAFAVVLFMAFDFFIVLGAFVQNKQNLFAPADKLINLCIAVAYILLATCAMYPGRQMIDHGTTTKRLYST